MNNIYFRVLTLTFLIILFVGLKRGLVLRFLIIKLFMCIERKATLIEHFINGRVSPGDHDYSMSREQFQKLHQHFHYPLKFFDNFSEKFCSFVCQFIF